MGATQVSNNRWLEKMRSVSVHKAVLLSHDEAWNVVICNNMDGVREYYAKWNKPDREGQIYTVYTVHLYIYICMYTHHHLYMGSKNKLVNIVKKEPDSEK